MNIIVPHQIRKRELGGEVAVEVRKLFAKLKEKPELAVGINAPGLPSRTTLHKVYATTEGGARRLLFFCRRPMPVPASGAVPQTPAATTDRWVLLFYRDKSDNVGKNMSPNNAEFTRQLAKNLSLAIQDIANSTADNPRYDLF
jgi:hypothetical protein